MKYPKSAGRTRVLLVNSDELVQKSLYEMLCRSGYEADMAASCREAIARLDEKPFHVILMDINKADDSKALWEIKEKAHPAAVIVLTSYGNVEMAVESIKMGAFDYLVRPIRDRKMISAIERATAGMPALKDVKPLSKCASCEKYKFHGMICLSALRASSA